MILYDLTAKKNGHYVSFMSKHNVLMAGKNLEYLHSFHENIRVKSGAWDENGVFVYSTLSHVKYCLPNGEPLCAEAQISRVLMLSPSGGDSGIIHSLQNPIYIVWVHKQHMYYVDREQQVLLPLSHQLVPWRLYSPA
eukprot:6461967-Amphidinium_carterae.1